MPAKHPILIKWIAIWAPWTDSKKAQLVICQQDLIVLGLMQGGPGEDGGMGCLGSLAISFICPGSQAREVFVAGMEVFNAELKFLSLLVHGVWVSLSFLCFTCHIHFSSQQGIPGGQQKLLYEDTHSVGGRVASSLCLPLPSPKPGRGAQLWGVPKETCSIYSHQRLSKGSWHSRGSPSGQGTVSVPGKGS